MSSYGIKFQLAALLITSSALSASLESYKFQDLTLEKWKEKSDPQLVVKDMAIDVGNWQFADKNHYTRAVWSVAPASGISCKEYKITFKVIDRLGNTVTEETKHYNYDINKDMFNPDATNILFSGPDHSAKFRKRFHELMYLTVQYWLTDLKCKKYIQKSVEEEPERVVFSLRDVISAARKEKNEEKPVKSKEKEN